MLCGANQAREKEHYDEISIWPPNHRHGKIEPDFGLNCNAIAQAAYRVL